MALDSLAEAREKAQANRKLAREGGDPLTERRRARNTPTFAEAPERVVEQERSGWRRSEAGRRVDGELSVQHLAAHRPDAGLGGDEQRCPGSARPIWHVEACTAQLVRQRIRAVLEWPWRWNTGPDNPCDRVVSVLRPQDAVVRHMRAMPHREVAAAVRRVRASNMVPVSLLAFEFLVLTAARWGEVRSAEWSEIDQMERMWTVPEFRMKSKREPRVPLCRRAEEILEDARTLDDGATRLMFTRGGGKPLGYGELRKLLHGNEIAPVSHGFRSSFRDWAAEETDHPREVVESPLAHVLKDKVEAAYRRRDLFERLRVLMEDWPSYLADGRSILTTEEWGSAPIGECK